LGASSLFYLYFIFVREEANKNGVINAQVISKQNGKSRLVKTIGSSKNVRIVADLVKQGHQFIASFGGQ